VFFSLVGIELTAQTTIPRQLTIGQINTDSTYFLGNWVMPESIEISAMGSSIPPTYWTFFEISGRIKFNSDLRRDFDLNELQIYYEELPLNLARTYQFYQAMEVDSAFFNDSDTLMSAFENTAQRPSFSQTGLTQSGSLSRGIIVGSNQDFSLESGLNFELSGPLTDEISINASLTDQSIPIQPDGTTQNLREFDKVFIQIKAPRASLEMGDVDVSLEQSSFAQYNRRLQGASGTVESGKYGEYSGAVSVVRGTFKSLQFEGLEGVQGPYRLTGKNDEPFVIILAGTERVYINGQRVQRGAENDYIIDYGLGEVTFTNNLLIKDETRIVIEYEYIDRNFNRTVVAAEGEASLFRGKFKIGASAIRQADGDDLLSQQTLSENDIELLQNVGDDLDQAIVSGATIATEDERDRFILYAQIDTTLGGETFTIYEHKPGSDESIYRVRFSNVGQNNGSYQRVSGETNGLLYEWVGPGLGSYDATRQLPAPEKQQMVALNGTLDLTENLEFFGEWAVSDYDENRFSSIGDDDNTDLGYLTGIRIKGMETAIGKVSGNIRRRYTGEKFEFFERIREVEFDRKWNIIRTEQSKESINQAEFSVQPTDLTMVTAEIGQVNRDGFDGLRQAFSFSSDENWLQLDYHQDWVKSDDKLLKQEGNWFRHQGTISKRTKINDHLVTPFIRFEQEDRRQRRLDTDSLLAVSQKFYELGSGIRLNLSSLELEAGFVYRDEKGVLGNDLADLSTAFEQRYKLLYQPNNNFSTENEFRIRNKTFSNEFEALGNQNRQGVLVRSVTNFMSTNRIFDGEIFYEANTKRQALLQETFIEVGPEIGQFVWEDLNEDGVQQVDEFFPEVSANEGTFIRQYLPSDELLPAVDLNVRLLHTFSPFKITEKDRWFTGLRLRSRIDLLENSTTADIADVYLLNLNTFRNDSTTIQGRIFWEQELDILRGWNEIHLKAGMSENRGLNQRNSESIESFSQRIYTQSEYDLTSRVRLKLNLQRTQNKSTSSRLFNRNYDIHTLSVEPGINGTINRNWNAGLEVSYAQKEDQNPIVSSEATLLKISTTQRLFLWRKVQTNLRLEFRDTQVSGSSSSYGNYELTEGTGEGQNLLWSLRSTYRVSNFIRFSLDYDGRTVSDRPSIHTVKLVMSATF
jgi:hypothetical protein